MVEEKTLLAAADETYSCGVYGSGAYGLCEEEQEAAVQTTPAGTPATGTDSSPATPSMPEPAGKTPETITLVPDKTVPSEVPGQNMDGFTLGVGLVAVITIVAIGGIILVVLKRRKRNTISSS